MAVPAVVVLAGPNGAGKSTTARRLLPRLGVRHFVNADDIARGLSAFEPESVAVTAGRIMLGRIEELAARQESFAFETTLAARSFAPLLVRLATSGYRTTLVYLWLRDPELARSRVAERVERGGHDIPSEVIVRRYWGGLRNFFAVYRPLARSWMFYDNSERRRTLVAYALGHRPEVVRQPELWAAIRARAGER